MTNQSAFSSLRTVDDHGVTYTALMFVCPGCAAPYTLSDGTEVSPSGLHLLPVNSPQKSPSWDWDGNLDAPTLSPSILTGGGTRGVDDRPFVCHSFLRGGVFEFLSDSTHSLAGTSVPLPPLPGWSGDEASDDDDGDDW